MAAKAEKEAELERARQKKAAELAAKQEEKRLKQLAKDIQECEEMLLEIHEIRHDFEEMADKLREALQAYEEKCGNVVAGDVLANTPWMHLLLEHMDDARQRLERAQGRDRDGPAAEVDWQDDDHERAKESLFKTRKDENPLEDYMDDDEEDPEEAERALKQLRKFKTQVQRYGRAAAAASESESEEEEEEGGEDVTGECWKTTRPARAAEDAEMGDGETGPSGVARD